MFYVDICCMCSNSQDASEFLFMISIDIKPNKKKVSYIYH